VPDVVEEVLSRPFTLVLKQFGANKRVDSLAQCPQNKKRRTVGARSSYVVDFLG
jgi:hypothetical protein